MSQRLADLVLRCCCRRKTGSWGCFLELGGGVRVCVGVPGCGEPRCAGTGPLGLRGGRPGARLRFPICKIGLSVYHPQKVENLTDYVRTC